MANCARQKGPRFVVDTSGAALKEALSAAGINPGMELCHYGRCGHLIVRYGGTGSLLMVVTLFYEPDHFIFIPAALACIEMCDRRR